MFIDTHAHIDGPEFDGDRNETIARAREAGAEAIFLPAIDAASTRRIAELCHAQKGFLYPMAGLHPEEVKDDWQNQLAEVKAAATDEMIAVGEVGLDFYWTRENEKAQVAAFMAQVEWALECRLPLMIHCRKAQNEMVNLLRPYEKELTGVFHCFTGNETEAAQLLAFPGFVLGVGGVLTFKKSHLPEVLPAAVPLSRVVLETDSPYMAPIPHRGTRNEPAYVAHVAQRMAEAYGISRSELEQTTTLTAKKLFSI